MNVLSPALAVPRAVAQLLDAINGLAGDVRAIRVGLEPTQDEVSVLQSEVVTIRTGLEPVQDQIEAMQADVAQLREDAGVLRHEMSGLTNQLDEVLSRLPDMKPGDSPDDDGLISKAKDALTS